MSDSEHPNSELATNRVAFDANRRKIEGWAAGTRLGGRDSGGRRGLGWAAGTRAGGGDSGLGG